MNKERLKEVLENRIQEYKRLQKELEDLKLTL